LKEQNRNFGLDLARAVAISLVVLDHFFMRLSILGWYGVDLFFVLSGFLIGRILLRKISKTPQFPLSVLREFWIRRWFRTIPNYALFLIINFIMGMLMLRPKPGGNPWHYFLFLQNFAWKQPLFFAESWSLAIEEWFYFLFALCLYVLNRLLLKTRYQLRSLEIVTLFFLILPFLLRFIFTPGVDWRLGSGRIVILRLDALMYGIVLARIYHDLPTFWSKLRIFFFPGLLVIISLIVVEFMGLPELHLRWLPALIFTLSPIGFSLMLPALSSLPQFQGVWAKAIHKVSLWSYSIYLCHLLVFILFKNIFEPRLEGLFEVAAFRLFVLTIVLVVSATIYHYFEKPMTKLRDIPSTQRVPI
jgi:peptidoglycan/LPS O-acetylase OafA/YrhL